MSESEAFTETVDEIDESVDEFHDEAADEAAEVTAGDDSASLDADSTNESEDTPGIPDEPEPFVEEIRAAGDLPETGDPRVDEVLSRLEGIESIPTAEHVAVYDEVHRGLQDALANLDQG